VLPSGEINPRPVMTTRRLSVEALIGGSTYHNRDV
jgi:hypothetical protein